MLRKYHWQHPESESCGYEYDWSIMERMLDTDPCVDHISKQTYELRIREGYQVTKPTKQLRHCMIDIETIDLIESAKIISIGAVIFDPRYGRISKDTFYMELDHKAQKNRSMNQETVDWWTEQSRKAKEALKGTVLLEDALEELAFWLPSDAKVWGNGPTFDISILEHAYRQHDIEIPWKFWNVRDCRTIKDMYESARGGYDKRSGGTCHNALDDAYYQAQYVIEMWRSLLKQ